MCKDLAAKILAKGHTKQNKFQINTETTQLNKVKNSKIKFAFYKQEELYSSLKIM